MALLEKKEFSELTGVKTKDLSNYERRGQVVYTPGGLIDTSNIINQVFYAKHRHKGSGAPVDFDVSEAPQKPNKRTQSGNAVRETAAKTEKKTATKVRERKPDIPLLPRKAKELPETPVPKKGRQTRKDVPDDQQNPGTGSSTERETPVARKGTSRKRVGDGTEDDEDALLSTIKADAKWKMGRAVKVTYDAELVALKVAKVRGAVMPTELVMPVFLQHSQSILMAQKAADDVMLGDIAHRFKIPPAEVATLRGQWTKERNAAVDRAIEASEKSIDAILINFVDEKI